MHRRGRFEELGFDWIAEFPEDRSGAEDIETLRLRIIALYIAIFRLPNLERDIANSRLAGDTYEAGASRLRISRNEYHFNLKKAKENMEEVVRELCSDHDKLHSAWSALTADQRDFIESRIP